MVGSLLLWLLLERTRLGAMIRAGVDDRLMARSVGIRLAGVEADVDRCAMSCDGPM